MTEIEIIPVTAENAADFGGVIYRSWGETYRGLIPDEVLDGRSADRWTERAKISPEGKFIAYVGDEAAGAIGILPQAREFCTHGDSGEIVSLYVLKKFRRMGIGSKLLAKAAEQLGGGITLFVLKGNVNAIDFYKKMGFEFTGKVYEEGCFTELEMYRVNN